MGEKDMKKDLSRRNFMKHAAIGAGAAVLLGSADELFAGNIKQPKKWDTTTDVLVIGFGGAGAAAAIEAHDAGAKVLILEKAPIAGGSTSLSGGVVYAGGTSIQNKAGISDSVAAMYKYYMAANSDLLDPETTRYLCDNSPDTIEWLMKLGVSFTPNNIYMSGMEVQYQSVTPAVKRGHIAAGKGGEIMSALVKAVKERKIDVQYNVAAERLIINEGGEVIGAQAVRRGKRFNIKAKRGVMLASGGITRSREMMKKYYPTHLKAVPCTGLESKGDGLRMAAEIGAPAATGTTDPPLGLPGLETVKGKVVNLLGYNNLFNRHPTLMVNEKALRFTNETEYYQISNPKILKQKKAFIIYDDNAGKIKEAIGFGLSKGLEKEFESGAIKKADTIPELAKLVGLDPNALVKTVEKYNKMAKAGVDEEFGKKKALLPLETPPFYIGNLGVSLVLCIAGLSSNLKSQVMDAFDKPIPRLYSAGEVNWNFYAYAGSGSMLTNCFVFGRVAGRNLAAEKPLRK